MSISQRWQSRLLIDKISIDELVIVMLFTLRIWLSLNTLRDLKDEINSPKLQSFSILMEAKCKNWSFVAK
jgi:hypothetical protein